jgi:hypothetical protein
MTVRELLLRMDAREFQEWKAKFHNDPFGTARGDLQAGIVASVLANKDRPRSAQRFTPDDFALQFGPRETRVMSEREIKDEVLKLNALFGGSIVADNRQP